MISLSDANKYRPVDGFVWGDWHKVRADHPEIMVVYCEDECAVHRSVDEPQEVSLALCDCQIFLLDILVRQQDGINTRWEGLYYLLEDHLR